MQNSSPLEVNVGKINPSRLSQGYVVHLLSNLGFHGLFNHNQPWKQSLVAGNFPATKMGHFASTLLFFLYIYISWMKWYEKYWNDQLRIQNHGHEFRITKTHSEPWWFTVVAVIHRNPDQEGSGAATNAAHRFPAFRKKKHSPFWNHRFLNECRVTIANAHPWWPRFIRQKNL